MEFEHIDRVTIVPQSWVIPLLIAGVIAMLLSLAQGFRALGGAQVPESPVLIGIAACAGAMWLMVAKLDKDWADGAIAGLIAMLAVDFGAWILRRGRRRRPASGER